MRTKSKASFLLDSVGERVFPEFVQLREQPFMPGALASANFDAEGVATREADLVSDGVIQTYLLDSYSARKLGLKSTATIMFGSPIGYSKASRYPQASGARIESKCHCFALLSLRNSLRFFEMIDSPPIVLVIDEI